MCLQNWNGGRNGEIWKRNCGAAGYGTVGRNAGRMRKEGRGKRRSGCRYGACKGQVCGNGSGIAGTAGGMYDNAAFRRGGGGASSCDKAGSGKNYLSGMGADGGRLCRCDPGLDGGTGAAGFRGLDRGEPACARRREALPVRRLCGRRRGGF